MEISKETFEKEIAICKEQHEKKQCCNWGKCETCGVVLLLEKLYNGNVVEKQNEVEKIKTTHLK